MKIKDFDYKLPKNLIAQEPVKPRDRSRLLVMDKATGRIEHLHFFDICDHLKSGDVLVLNDTKVFPARLIGRREETGGKVEIFLLKKKTSPRDSEIWECLVGGPRRKVGINVEFKAALRGEIISDNRDGTWLVQFNLSGDEFMAAVERIGQMPLPPYIKRDGRLETADGRNYQTVYADKNKAGSVAAPTAGLHFTPRLISKLEKMGVQIEFITLHVGLGTFSPVETEDLKKHKMHAEWVEAEAGALKRIWQAKSEGRRVIAVGTTTVRTLEALAKFSIFPAVARFSHSSGGRRIDIRNPKFKNFSGWINVFIYPGFRFKVADGMITNFHLPKSTLLMLVSAFAGKKNIDKAYRNAIKKKYRFYSYGDAMLIM